MVINNIRLLENTKAKVARLEKSIATQLKRELASLPRKYGFATVPDFIGALRGVAGQAMVSPRFNGGVHRRKPRAIITAVTRARVKSLVAAGKTGSEIAEAVDISVPSVQNIKKELGLVNIRNR